MSPLWIALLASAVVVLIAAEWPHLERRFGSRARQNRARAKRKAGLKLIRTETEEFAASVERDLAKLPTVEEREENGRR